MEMEVQSQQHQASSQQQQTYMHHPPQQHHHIHVNHHHHAHHHNHTILPIISSSSINNNNSSNSVNFEPKEHTSRVMVNNSKGSFQQACCSASSSCSTSPVVHVAEGVNSVANGSLVMSPNKIPTCISPEVSNASSREVYFDPQQIFDGILRVNGHQSPASESSSSQQNSVLKHLDDINANSLSLIGRSLSNDRKRPYPCNLCSSKFGSKMELEEHQNSHTGMKPFQCDICQSRFNRRSTLWNHKRIHNDAKPFVCNICTMTFKWKNSLKCHKEMHLRKNETNSVQDTDIRLLTYATAAKKCLGEFQCEMNDENPALATDSNNSSSSSMFLSGNARKRGASRSHKSLAKNILFNSADSRTLQLERLGHQQQQSEPVSVIFSPKASKSIKLEDLPSDTAAFLEGSGLLLNSTEEFIRQQFSENGGFDMSNLPPSHSPSILSSHVSGILSSPNMHSSKQPQQHCGLENNQSITTSGFLNATRSSAMNGTNANLHIDSSLFNCNLQINGQQQQTDLFSQLDHENSKMPNFLDQSGCTLNMRLPFLNFDLQQLNNSLVEQQTQNLQHSSSAFDSFSNLQNQQIQQHCSGGSSFNLPGNTSASTSMTNHSSAEMLLGGSLSYPLGSTAILTAAAAAANASSTASNSELAADNGYFDYSSVTSSSIDNSYNNNINSLIHQQQLNHSGGLDLVTNNGNQLIGPLSSEDPLASLMHPAHNHNYLNY